MRRKITTALAALVLILLAAIGLLYRISTQHGPVGAAASQAPAPVAAAAVGGVQSQQQLRALIAKDGVTPERAKLYFSLAIGTLPGVTIPAGIARDPAEFDGTPAAVDLMQVWDTLTQEQRQAAAKLMGLPAAAALVKTAYFVTNPHFDYNAYLKDADGALAALLNVPGITYTYDIDYGLPPNGTSKAMTLSWSGWQIFTRDWTRNSADSCNVRIFDQMFEGLTDLDARAVMTHEMMHCYQERIVGDFNDWKKARDWVKEGEATWAMAEVVPGGKGVVAEYWNGYATSPATAFSDRSYDGLGIFGHFSDLAGSEATWTRLLQATKLDVGGDDVTSLKYLIEGNEDSYFSSWGSSYYLTSGKTPWTMSGPGHPPESGYTPGGVSVGPDATTVLDAASWQARMAQISGDADIVIVSLLTGYGRVHDQPFNIDTRLDTSGPVALCIKPGGCTCPDGSPGASVTTQRATAPVSVGMEGADIGAQLLVMGKSMDGYCKDPDKPQPPGNPGGGGGGGAGGDPDPDKPSPHGGTSEGDTHITTFDGVRYDFQVVGEYTLVRSTKDDFVIQVRQVPALQSRTVTVNQAMATKIDGKRVSIASENSQLVLRVNGAVATDAIPKLAGGSITRSTTMYGTSYLFEWPDGTKATVSGARLLDVRVKPASGRKGALAGLLGDADGSKANDLVGTGGASLGLKPSPEDIGRALADRWRISQDASLFDYQPGQTTATFTDPTFPDPHVDPSYAANAVDAEKRCRESGIIDPHLLHNCIVDFAVTSDFLFVSSYSHAQQVLAARARIAPPTTSGVLRTVTLEATVTDQHARPSLQFAAKAGDIIWAGNPDCADNYLVGLFLPDGKGAAGGWVCAVGRLALPSTGTYTLKVPDYKREIAVGTYHVPIRFVRPDRQRDVSYGGVVSGVIETAGVHDVFNFQGHAGDVLRIAGEGCALDNLVVGLIDPARHDFLGPSCRSGSDTRLMATGSYQLVINAADGGSGPYHFVFQGVSSNGLK
jgi:hypothetical protein